MLIGLTGNFGSGKSLVLNFVWQYGVTTVSSDDIVRELLGDAAIKSELITILGDILDNKGEIDKKKMAGIIFKDSILRKKAEAVIHPKVMEKIIQTHNDVINDNSNGIVVAEIPLLFEAGLESQMDSIIIVTCDPKEVKSRLMKKGFTKDEIELRLKSQLSMEEKVKKSDHVIDNSLSSKETQRQIKNIMSKVKE